MKNILIVFVLVGVFLGAGILETQRLEVNQMTRDAFDETMAQVYGKSE